MTKATEKVAELPKKARPEHHRTSLPCFSAGTTMVDLALGGGWAESHLINIVGDTGAGKTLAAYEAIANFQREFPHSRVRYIDTEGAFDESVAKNLGLDVSRIELPDVDDVPRTIEGVMKDSFQMLKECKAANKRSKGSKKLKALYIVDSWDGLSDDAEEARDIDAKNTYGTSKARKGSEFGRRLASKIHGVMTVVIISQVRENIGVSFGAKYSRSGGKWLDFYAHQIVWIASGEKLYATKNKSKRSYGRWTVFKVTKNRRRAPCEPVKVPILWNYGSDDLMACLQFILDENRAHELLPDRKEEAAVKEVKDLIKASWNLTREQYDSWLQRAQRLAKTAWASIDEAFSPKRRKYGV